MLCNECYQEIESGKEIQIEGSIFCKKCAQKPFSECYTCEVKIYRKDQVYESSISRNKGFNIWLLFNSEGNSEKIIQCRKCYREWRSQFKKWEKSSKVKKVFYTCLGFLLGWIFFLFYPNIKKKLDNTPGVILFPLLLVFCFVFFAAAAFLDMMDNRYKIRRRTKKEIKNKKASPQKYSAINN